MSGQDIRRRVGKAMAVLATASLFGVAAPGRAAAADFAVSAPDASAYVINGANNPTLTLTRGKTYTFAVSSSGHPFFIKTAQVPGTGSTFDTGVTNNGIDSGTLTFVVPAGAPTPLFYACEFHSSMSGVINVVSAPVPAVGGGGRALLVVALLAGGATAVRWRRRASRAGAMRR